jgi:hypothetical protein
MSISSVSIQPLAHIIPVALVVSQATAPSYQCQWNHLLQPDLCILGHDNLSPQTHPRDAAKQLARIFLARVHKFSENIASTSKILDITKVMQGKVPSDSPQMLDATLQNFVTWDMYLKLFS